MGESMDGAEKEAPFPVVDCLYEEIKRVGARTIVLTPINGDPRVQESALRPLIITTILII